MQPFFVLCVLLCICSLTTTIYWFRIPASLTSSRFKPLTEIGYWGIPNAEFDWCEPNHLYSPYLAEPVNCLTMIPFIMVVIVLYRKCPVHFKHSRLLLLETMLIAIGSFLFHATLQYKMQLLDELPMYALVIHASFLLWYRFTTPNMVIFSACVALFVTVSSGLLYWPQEDPIHQILRGILTYSFAIQFIYIFVAGSKLGLEADKRLKLSNCACSRLFTKSFVSFIIAITGWIFDILFCDTLLDLPFNFPYPHMHGLIWHLGTCSGLYYLIQLTMLSETRDFDSIVAFSRTLTLVESLPHKMKN